MDRLPAYLASIDDVHAVIGRIRRGESTSGDADLVAAYLLPRSVDEQPEMVGEYLCEVQVSPEPESRIRDVMCWDNGLFDTDRPRNIQRWWLLPPNFTASELTTMQGADDEHVTKADEAPAIGEDTHR